MFKGNYAGQLFFSVKFKTFYITIRKCPSYPSVQQSYLYVFTMASHALARSLNPYFHISPPCFSEQVVAVKRLHSLPGNAEDLQLFFRQEATLLAKLNHPNVVRYFGVSFAEPHFYIVTEFCPSTLHALITECRNQEVYDHLVTLPNQHDHYHNN